MIPLVNLNRQYQELKCEIDDAVQAVFASGAYVNGPFVERFEKDFALYCGTAHAVGVASGTAALHLSLLACGVGPGDEVITTAATFVATVAAITYCGAKPVLADVRAEAPLLDSEAVERAITDRTRAIVPVHLFGHACNMDAIGEVAARHGLKVVEDASQAHGACWRGRRVGGFGHAAAFSCYPGKNLGAAGDAGVATTNDVEIAKTMRQLRNWALDTQSLHARPAFNARLDAVHAAVLSAKLPKLDRWNQIRRNNADKYRQLLTDLSLDLPEEPEGSQSVWHVFALRHPERDKLAAYLKACGVQTGSHYPQPIHLQPAYADLGRQGDFPNAEAWFSGGLSLPVCPGLSSQELAHIADSVRKFVADGNRS